MLLIHVGGHLDDVGERKTCFVFWSDSPGSDVSDPRTKPSPVNHPIGQQETKNELTKQGEVGERRAPFYFAPTKTNHSQTGNVFSGKCRSSGRWVEAKWVGPASALITCTVTPHPNTFWSPLQDRRKQKLGEASILPASLWSPGSIFVFAPARKGIFGGLLWSNFEIVGTFSQHVIKCSKLFLNCSKPFLHF